MGIVNPTTEQSEAFGDAHHLPRASGLERGAADTAFRGVVTPSPAHHFSSGVLLPESCAWCGMALFEHVP
jgi:hypothetical protein